MVQGIVPIGLREWVDGALNSVDASSHEPRSSAYGADRGSQALSTEEFLISALTVAHSLAGQICQAEEEAIAEQGLVEGPATESNGGQFYLPVPGNNWADLVTIYLVTPDDKIENDNVCGPPISPDEISLQGKGGTNLEGGKMPYLSVTSAELAPPSNNHPPNFGHKDTENIQRILYSLGLVFYEIFSGGDRPPEMMANTIHQKDTEELDDVVPIPSNQSGIINFSKKSSLLDGDGEATEEQSRSAKRALIQSDIKSYFTSLDPLKSKGLPGPLCDLIANMISCADGDLSGDEAYSQISDVFGDISRMLDKPRLFLYDLDMENLSRNGLQVHNMFGRETELAALQSSYRRSISGKRECGIISGLSGTGKSVLANRLGSYATSSGGVFLSGKFDPQQAKPFFALTTAFNQYCDMLLHGGSTSHTKEVATELDEVLGKDAFHLMRVIPSLRNLIGHDDSELCEGQGCLDTQKRLRYLLCQFVTVISSFSEPVTLFIDDVQWADEASLEVIYQLLLMSESSKKSKKFYFLACIRLEDMIDDNNPFCNIISRVGQFSVGVTTVELACIDEDATNTLISESLCLSPRLTRPLSALIFHKTRGNLFFVSRLLMSLSKDGLLNLSLSRRRWEWDEEKIQSRQLPDDVASFLVSTTQSLPEEVISALSVLSCFGIQSEYTVIQKLEAVLGFSLVQPLELAAAEGLLDRINGSYVFCHDKVQEAVYGTIKAEERCLLHFKYGVALVPPALELKADGIDGLLFIAANQINMGGPKAVSDDGQIVILAHLNLQAGYSAMEMSDYSSAYSYFDHGISFLRKNDWEENYDLSLQLFDAAAKSAFAIGDIDSLKLLQEQIFTFGKTLADKLSSYYVLVSALACAMRLLESIEKGITIVHHLGEEIPNDASEADVNLCLKETQTFLANVTDEQLLNHEEMTDDSKIMAMKFLARLQHSLQMAKPVLQPVCTLKMVHLSLTHGMSPISASAFTYYGVMLAQLGDVREGYRYVKIGLKLLDRVGSEEVSGQVICLGTQIMCYVEPVQAAIELHLQGHDSAMVAGDTDNAMLNKLLYTIGSYWSSGLKLPSVKENYSNLRRSMKQYSQLTWSTFLSILEISALSMLGLEDEIDQTTNFTRNPLAAIVYHFQNFYINFMFRRYDQMLMSVEEYVGSNLKTWSLLYTDSCQTFILGLVSFWVFRKSNDAEWFERGHKAKLAFSRWAESSDWNFDSKLHLLEAEESFSKSDFGSARLSYEKAISFSKAHRFLNDEALACELAGYCFFERDEKEASLGFFLRANDKYQEWGACAKADALSDFIQQDISLSTAISITPSIADRPDDGKRNNRRRRVSECLEDESSTVNV